MARSNDDPKAPPSHPAQNGFAGKRHFPGNFCPKAASLKGYSVTHGDEREIGVLHDVNVLTEKVLLVDRLHLLTDSSHSDPCLPTRLDDPK